MAAKKKKASSKIMARAAKVKAGKVKRNSKGRFVKG